ncbi:MAG TPA: methyl-accepting chemotaxis protein [Verrucomicrobiae bacterium]|nr:methyl-accepting chemotaxis protein [Verrucomicrobiae bacterium]
MKNSILWHGSRTAQLLSILLLVSCAWLGWSCRDNHQQTAAQIARLEAAKDRACTSLGQMTEFLEGLLLEPKNDAARKRARLAQTDLAGAVDALPAEYPASSEIVARARNLLAIQTRIVEQMDSDPPGALAAFHKNYFTIQDERADLVKNLNLQAATMASELFAKDKSRDALSLAAIILLLALNVVGVWWRSSALEKPIAELAGALEKMRRGDFTQRFQVDGFDELGPLGQGLNDFALDLSVLVGKVKHSGSEVNATAARIAATAQEQQSTATAIAASTAQVGATSRQISETSRELVKTIDEISDVAEETAALANNGQSAIARMETNMRLIMEGSGAITSKLVALSEKTAAINSVVTTITKVADQTNLLSLNAAIEAEKAGEYGLGFAVVAMEIRRLADQTAVATYDIERTVKEMQSAVAAGVTGMDKFSEEVRSGVHEIRQIGVQLGQIIQQVHTLTSRFQTVNEGMHAQASGAHQVSHALAELTDAARRTADLLRQSNAAIEQLTHSIQGLQSTVVRFKVEG